MADDMRTPENRAPSWVDKLPGWVKPVVLAGGIATAIGGAAALRGQEQQPAATPTPSAAAASPTPERTPAATPTVAPTPEPTTTPEVKEVPCKFLPDELCSQGEWFLLQIEGKNYIYVGYNLPPGVEVPLRAIVDGRLLLGKEGGDPFVGSSASIRTSTENYTIKGNIDSSKYGNLTSVDVKAGDIIGYAQSTNDKSLGFDIVFSVFRAGPEVAEDKLKELLPEVLKKPSKGTVVAEDFKPGATVVFLDSPK